MRHDICSAARHLGFLLVWIGCMFTAGAQRYSRISYHREQGLDANTVYAIRQDRQGYLWIGTDNGLFRFDGYGFRHFTTQDGLPDNEILAVCEDGRGRLWALSAAGALSYISGDRIFNAENDTLLAKMIFTHRPGSLLFDRDGVMWVVLENRSLTRISLTGDVSRNLTFGGSALQVQQARIGPDGLLQVIAGNQLWSWNRQRGFVRTAVLSHDADDAYIDTTFCYYAKKGQLVQGNIWAYPAASLQTHRAPVLPQIYQSCSVSDSTVLLGSDPGAFIFNLRTRTCTQQLLTGSKTGSVLKAKDGSLWCGTAYHGLYRFVSSPVQVLPVPGSPSHITYLETGRDGVSGTTSSGSFLQTRTGRSGRQEIQLLPAGGIPAFTDCQYACRDQQGRWTAFINRFVGRGPRLDRLRIQDTLYYVKAALRDEKHRLLVGTTGGIYRYDTEVSRPTDTFLRGLRITALAVRSDIIYAGTISGVAVCAPGGITGWLCHEDAAMRKKITAVCAGAGDMLWVANSAAELSGIRDGRIVARPGNRTGLQCRRILCLKSAGSLLWAGTDNGIYALSQLPPYKVVCHIGRTLGLAGNLVNCLAIDDHRIWAGTPGALNYFDTDERGLITTDPERRTARSPILINGMQNGDRQLAPSAETITLQDQELRLDVDLIDFQSDVPPVFEYSIDDGRWIPLRSGHLLFSSLPYGAFTLRLRASGPNGLQDAVFSQQFSKPRPVFLRWWFICAALFAAAAGTGLAVYLLTGRMIRKKQEMLAVQKNLLRLEQMALQGQMNPHFIFNCIAAIKQHYSAGDIDRAEDFIDAFSTLIRQTFELSAQTVVPLHKELDYLTQYLNIEQARFSNSFTFRVLKEPDLPEHEISVPAMLLQPIVENAIRHGIRHLPDGSGHIEIRISREHGRVRFEITDNGTGLRPGRADPDLPAPRRLNSSAVNSKRIKLLNQLSGGQITVTTETLPAGAARPGGTRVTITVPLNFHHLAHEDRYHRG